MIFNHLTLKRRPFRASLFIVVLLALIATQMNIPSGMAGVTSGPKGPVFDIVPDNTLSTLTTSSVKGTPFYMQGTIYMFRTFNPGDCTALFSGADLQNRVLGTWRAWGTVADSSGKLVLHQTLAFDLNSTIEVQGVNGLIAPNGAVTVDIRGNATGPSEVLSVVGGSGQFRALSGEAVIRPYCSPNPMGTNPFRFDRPFCLGVE